MIEQARIETIFDEMGKYVIDLVPDPASMGPSYIQDLVATCRNHLNKVSLVFSELSREKMALSSQLRAHEASYKLEYDSLMATDEHVKRLANIEDRKSTVSHMLRDKQRASHQLKETLHNLEAVYKVVSHRSRELHATMNVIKDQRRMMQTEIQTGAFYGDERVPKPSKPYSNPNGPMSVDDIGADELDAMLGSVSPPSPGAVVETVAEETSITNSTPANDDVLIENFLGTPDVIETPKVSVPKADDSEDLSALLDGLSF